MARLRAWVSAAVALYRRIDRVPIARFPAVYATCLFSVVALWSLSVIVLVVVLLAIPVAKAGSPSPIAGIVWALYVMAFLTLLVYGFVAARRVASFRDGPISPGRTAAFALMVGLLIVSTPGLAHQILYQRLDRAVGFSGGDLCREVKVLNDMEEDCSTAWYAAMREEKDDGEGERPSRAPTSPRKNPWRTAAEAYEDIYDRTQEARLQELAIFEGCRRLPRVGFFGSRLGRIARSCKAHGMCHPDMEVPEAYLLQGEASVEACRYFEDEFVIKDARHRWEEGPWGHRYGKEYAVYLSSLEVLAARGPLSFRTLDFGLITAAIVLSTLMLTIIASAVQVWLRSALFVVAALGLASLVDITLKSIHPLSSLNPRTAIRISIALFIVCLLIVAGAYRWARLRGWAIYTGAVAALASPVVATLLVWSAMPWQGHDSGPSFVGIFRGVGEYVNFGTTGPNARLELYPPGQWQHKANLHLPQILGLAQIAGYAICLALYAPLVTRMRFAPRD